MSARIMTMRLDGSRVGRIALHPLRLLLSPRLWQSLAFLLLNLPAGLLYFSVLFTLLSVGLGMLPVGVGLVLLALVPPLTLLGTRIERLRANRLLGVVLPSPGGNVFASLRSAPEKPLIAEGSRLNPLHMLRALFRSSWALAHERDTWRSLAYLLLLYPIGTIEIYAFKVQWDIFTSKIAGPALAAIGGLQTARPGLWELLGISSDEWMWLVALLGIFISLLWLFAEAYLIVGVGRAHRAMALWLLGTSRRAERARLEARVQALDQSRMRLLDAVLLERQRIERDLHDGAQQRLVALALDLGMAREKLATQPEVAQALVTQAHEEAKRALAELRELVRGIHPAVLADRGLDPALSALAARCPVPVSVTVELTERPVETVEATAYFVAAEALANIAKHSGATEASVEVRRAGDMLQMTVSDNGHGGADSARGTGLAGMADRVGALDGKLTVTSPAGGPTRLVMEVPWKAAGA